VAAFKNRTDRNKATKTLFFLGLRAGQLQRVMLFICNGIFVMQFHLNINENNDRNARQI
jgi:hypothetical protein